MFQISMETDYALRCMLLLALKYDEIYGASRISEERLIPRPFLTKILQKLARAGLVTSIRGSKGGFKLAKHPSKILVLEIIEAMEGAIAISRCAVDLKKCDFSQTCALCPVWVEIKGSIIDKLGGWNLESLLVSKGYTITTSKSE
ncbi:MAG: Rrf2 family transcriptional regulator [Nitrospirae bacterium]|nr:Rrf2 family transcriptional regulator [Nitrospirota bacterium]